MDHPNTFDLIAAGITFAGASGIILFAVIQSIRNRK